MGPIKSDWSEKGSNSQWRDWRASCRAPVGLWSVSQHTTQGGVRSSLCPGLACAGPLARKAAPRDFFPEMTNRPHSQRCPGLASLRPLASLSTATADGQENDPVFNRPGGEPHPSRQWPTNESTLFHADGSSMSADDRQAFRPRIETRSGRFASFPEARTRRFRASRCCHPACRFSRPCASAWS
jgi:hypothetical protein